MTNIGLLILPLIIGLTLLLGIPSLIVIKWKSRPILAYVLACFLMFSVLVLPGIIQTFQAMMIYGSSDPQLMAGGIAQAFVQGVMGGVILFPLLALIQWVARRKYKKA